MKSGGLKLAQVLQTGNITIMILLLYDMYWFAIWNGQKMILNMTTTLLMGMNALLIEKKNQEY